MCPRLFHAAFLAARPRSPSATFLHACTQKNTAQTYMDVLFVHGYSETSLGAYFDLPSRLKAALPSVDRIVLAAFNSLDDTITIDDLAEAMETRMRALENGGAFTMQGAAIVCHSTGALVARRWLLNRLATGKVIPSHLVSMAGANHGSTLAQMGKSIS